MKLKVSVCIRGITVKVCKLVSYLQLVLPTLLKPWGQLLVLQAAKEVQEVYKSCLCEISHRPGGEVAA